MLRSVDMVVCLGDSLNMSTADQACDETIATGEGEFGHIIACLENIVCAVVYIPGNVRNWVLAQLLAIAVIIVLIYCSTIRFL